MKRRLFLQGIGGAALAAPFLSSLQRPARAQEMSPPRRLVIFYTNNGCLTNRWFPPIDSGNGPITASSLETPQADGKPRTLAALAPLSPKLLFPRGLAMPINGFNNKVDDTAYFDPHDQGMGSKLTCAPIETVGTSHYALSHSLDWEVARLFNQGAGKEPLVLSVSGFGNGVKQIVSYSASREPKAPTTNARTVYSSLTGLFSGEETEADYRVKRGESIIDLVSDDLNAFKKLNMSSADHKKVDDWLSLLRETEGRVIPAACTRDAATALGVTDAELTAAGYGNGGFPGGGGGGGSATAWTLGSEMMIRLIALTMMCDGNRSIILQWPGFATFNWDDINHTYDHHGLSHRNGTNNGGGECVSGVLEQLHQIDLWYAGRYAKLVQTIDSIQEEGPAGTSMLDNSAVMWLPELSDGNAHNNNNLPIVIAGSAGGYLKQGVSVNIGNLTGNNLMGNSEATCADGGQNEGNTGSSGGTVPLNKLYVTLINALGAGTPGWTPIDSFGISDAVAVGFGGAGPSFTTDGNGTVIDGPGIASPGEIDAIKAG